MRCVPKKFKYDILDYALAHTDHSDEKHLKLVSIV